MSLRDAHPETKRNNTIDDFTDNFLFKYNIQLFSTFMTNKNGYQTIVFYCLFKIISCLLWLNLLNRV